jgi:hypothetical protein
MGERIALFLLNFQNQFEQKTTSFLIDGTLFDILFGNVTGGRRPEVEFLNGIFSRGFWVHRIRPQDSVYVVESRLGDDSKHLLRASLENLYSHKRGTLIGRSCKVPTVFNISWLRQLYDIFD